MLTVRKTSCEPLLISDPVVEAVLFWLSGPITSGVVRDGVPGSCREVALSGQAPGDGRLFGDGCGALVGGRVGGCSPYGLSRLPGGEAGV
jgi:hypothetical protein